MTHARADAPLGGGVNRTGGGDCGLDSQLPEVSDGKAMLRPPQTSQHQRSKKAPTFFRAVLLWGSVPRALVLGSVPRWYQRKAGPDRRMWVRVLHCTFYAKYYLILWPKCQSKYLDRYDLVETESVRLARCCLFASSHVCNILSTQY